MSRVVDKSFATHPDFDFIFKTFFFFLKTGATGQWNDALAIVPCQISVQSQEVSIIKRGLEYCIRRSTSKTLSETIKTVGHWIIWRCLEIDGNQDGKAPMKRANSLTCTGDTRFADMEVRGIDALYHLTMNILIY